MWRSGPSQSSAGGLTWTTSSLKTVSSVLLRASKSNLHLAESPARTPLAAPPLEHSGQSELRANQTLAQRV